MDEAFRDLLLQHPLIAGVVQRRVDWGVRPQGDALPAITLQRISSIPQMNLDGAAGWYRDRIQVDCWARTYKAAKDLALTMAGEGGLLVGYRDERLGVRMRTFILGRRSDSDSDDQGVVHRTSVDVDAWNISLG